VQVEICSLSGLLPTEACPYRQLEWYIQGTQPTAQDTFYREVKLDSQSGLIATAQTPPERWSTQVVLDLPAQAQPWARQQGLLLYTDLIGDTNSELAQGEVNPLDADQPTLLRMVSPAAYSTFRLSESMQAEAQRIRLEAVSSVELRSVTFWVDGELVARLDEPPYQTWWTLTAGQHQVWAEAERENGEIVSTEPVVITVETASTIPDG